MKSSRCGYLTHYMHLWRKYSYKSVFRRNDIGSWIIWIWLFWHRLTFARNVWAINMSLLAVRSLINSSKICFGSVIFFDLLTVQWLSGSWLIDNSATHSTCDSFIFPTEFEIWPKKYTIHSTKRFIELVCDSSIRLQSATQLDIVILI